MLSWTWNQKSLRARLENYKLVGIRVLLSQSYSGSEIWEFSTCGLKSDWKSFQIGILELFPLDWNHRIVCFLFFWLSGIECFKLEVISSEPPNSYNLSEIIVNCSFLLDFLRILIFSNEFGAKNLTLNDLKCYFASKLFTWVSLVHSLISSQLCWIDWMETP